MHKIFLLITLKAAKLGVEMPGIVEAAEINGEFSAAVHKSEPVALLQVSSARL